MFSSIDPTISIEKLQNSPEGQYLDRKSARLAPKELAKHISAFANADGGIIVLGIEDDGRITGLTPVQENSFRQAPADFLQVLPGARFLFLRYEGTETGVGTNINIIKDITIEKPLPRLLEEAKQVLSVQMREFQQLDKDGKFKKIPEYPEFAWLEGVVNAVVHRDYSISGDHIRVSMYDDRIEFSSPGKLPSIVTVDNIKETRFSRNPLIARVLTDFGWVRELNEGVKRIYLVMEAYFLEPPLFSEPGITVKLVLKNNIAMRAVRKLEAIKGVVSEDVWNELGSLEQNIILCVANIKNCTPKILMELTRKSRNSINIRLKGLVEKGILVDHSSSRRDPTRFYTVGK